MLKHIHREVRDITDQLENELRLLRGSCGDEHEELLRELDDALLEIRSALAAESKPSKIS